MSKGALIFPNDSEVQESITNITTWLQTHKHLGPQQPTEKISSEDLAVAVPGECLIPELADDNELATQEDEKGILVYTDSTDEKYIWLKNEWHTVESILKITAPKNGWVRVTNLGERLLVLILTQLDYTAREAEFEVPYGCCPLSDPAYLLWIEHCPVGMCSLKTKGTKIWGGEDEYSCDTLDTLYVRPSARRQGHSLSLLRTLILQLPTGEHLALSHPVSLSMCKVLAKFISLFPELRGTLWTLDEDGEVSGTVELMLGSIMMREGFGPDFFQTTPQITTTPSTRTATQTPSSERPPPSNPAQDSQNEAEEPCDTS